MGQEAGKPAWPKPAGGYQTITGRRYGRRHAYIGFRPTLAKQNIPSPGNDMEWQELEMSSVHEENSLSSNGQITSPLQAILPVESNSVHPEASGTNFFKDISRVKHVASQKGNEATSFSYKKLKSDCDDPNSKKHLGPKKSSEACAWPTFEDQKECSRSPIGLSFVNIDSYEPDSSDGEEDELSGNSSIEAHPGFQKRLDNMICELEKEFDYLSGLHSYLCTKTCENHDPLPKSSCPERDIEEPQQNSFVSQKSNSSVREESINLSNICNDRQKKLEDSEINVSLVSECTPQKSFDWKNDQGVSQTEMVVRPKIRKQSTDSHLEKSKGSQLDDAQHGFCRKTQAANNTWSSIPPFFLTQTEKPEKEFLYEISCTDSAPDELRPFEGKQERTELHNRNKHDEEDDDLWEDLEDFGEKCVSFIKDDNSSECSEGEWSATCTSESGVDKQQCSSGESWETLPGLDEPEHDLQSNSSSLDDIPDINFNPEGPMLLEEGEIPWLPYQEETDSSSDEETDGMSHFVHPGLFMLDGNNNFEDDSSMSEDFDAEWRLLDEFGEGFGVAQAISYVDPQLLTYMALEERLAQAMEAALAHLESLAIDVEQAHPPATEEIIDCLPQITVLEDHHGQEQCCAICCCEYIKDEIATELPCHHVFHKTCVSLWLQKSGTCPVCRHVLSPALPEAAVATSFVSDHDTPPSTHSAAGMR
ncbi:PJA2 ligase, partial [Atractosteus spatula]|nr:PJA2 ligase [Atractosteus spatula]